MIYLKQEIGSTLVAVWQIEESKEELLSLLERKDWLNNIISIKAESRLLEMLAARVLIKELLGEEKEIEYNHSGKPFLKDKTSQISISHTKKYVAVALDKTRAVALDIEQVSEKIRKVRSRLVSPKEYIDEKQELTHLLLHWSAKEAMFKYIDIDAVNFIDHLFVEKFTPEQEGEFIAIESRTAFNYHFNAYYKVIEDFVLVCLSSIK